MDESNRNNNNNNHYYYHYCHFTFISCRQKQVSHNLEKGVNLRQSKKINFVNYKYYFFIKFKILIKF